MRWENWFGLTLFAMLSASVASAEEPYTDLELGAAYCIGRLQAESHVVPSTGYGDPDATRNFINSVLASNDRNIARLRDYLVSKGLLSLNRNPIPLMLASKHGSEDFDECQRVGMPQMPEITNFCSKDCSHQAPECLTTCEESLSLPACQRMSRCTQIEAELPAEKE